MNLLGDILVFAPPLLIAVMLHEVAHGYVAGRLGDPTARQLGRITLNPLRHVDLYMTIIIPALLIFAHSPFVFGGAKPIPVNPFNFRNPRRGMAWVAIAGPLTNFLLAGISYLLLVLAGRFIHGEDISAAGWLLLAWLSISVTINIVLGVFNLFPIPPLDGGRIAVGFLPVSLAKPLSRLEPYGILIVIGLLFALHSLWG